MKIKTAYIILMTLLFTVSANSQQLYLKWTNPTNLTILNSEADDFAPSWNRFEKVLYFNSTRDKISKFYKSKLIDSNKFDKPVLVKGEINKTGNNVSYISFFAEDKAYLTSFKMNTFRPFFNIFETILTRDGWSTPLQVNNFIKEKNMLHPTVSPDGTMLVIASDMNSEDHKTDLFISYINENGQWGDLEALTSLNTEGNEITPHFASDDTLFLASDGQGGPGGFDLFYSIRRPDGSWTKPNPLHDLNTAYDESDLTVLDGNFAVFASNRPGSRGGLDLYLTSSYLSEYKIAPERMLEISIATQIMTLHTSDDFNYENMPLINAVFSDVSAKNLDSIFKVYDNSELLYDLNSIYYQTMSIIGRRMTEFPGTKLIINYNILETEDKNIKLPDTKAVADRAKKYFVEEWNIPPQDIFLEKHLKNLTGAELSAYPMIYLDADNPKIFRYLEIGDRNVDIDPPFSDIFIKIKPEENLISWTTQLITPEHITNYFRESNLASDQFTISLADYADIFRKVDSVMIVVNAVNKFGDTISKELHFDLTHSETKKRKYKFIDGVKFERIYIFIPEDLPGENSNYLTDIIQKIAESAEFGKSLKIQFFSISGQQRAIAFKELLDKKIDLPYLKTDIEQVPYEGDLPFTRKFAPFVIRILIEKI
jgi:hypothetical protein